MKKAIASLILLLFISVAHAQPSAFTGVGQQTLGPFKGQVPLTLVEADQNVRVDLYDAATGFFLGTLATNQSITPQGDVMVSVNPQGNGSWKLMIDGLSNVPTAQVDAGESVTLPVQPGTLTITPPSELLIPSTNLDQLNLEFLAQLEQPADLALEERILTTLPQAERLQDIQFPSGDLYT